MLVIRLLFNLRIIALLILIFLAVFLYYKFSFVNKAKAANLSFFDHFSSGSLDPRWNSLNSGNGLFSLSDSNAQCSSPQTNDACIIYYANKIDKSQSGIYAFSISNASSSFPQTWVSLINSTNPPTPDTSTNIDLATRFRIKAEIQSSKQGITLDYYDTNHIKKQWNSSSNSWTSTASLANTPITGDDYYVVAFENDAVNNRFRSLIWAKRSSNGNYTFDQGLRLFTLTNWVSWSSVEASNDLWLVLGDPYTNLESGTMKVEWARFDGGTKQDVWTNSKSSQGDTYVNRHGWGYESANGTLEFIVPEDRSTYALDKGLIGAWDSANIKDPYVLFDPADNTYYMIYAGSGSGSGFQIGLATSNSPNGTFTRYGTSPIIPRLAGTNESQVSAPAIVKDLSEVDPNKMFKMLYTGFGSDSNFRVFYATAPDMRGPWTKQGVVLDIGAPGSFDQNGLAGARVVFENGLWYVFLGAKNNSETGGPWRITYASGPTLNNLTKSNVILVDKGVGPAQNITANISGRTVKVANTAGFVADAYIEIDQDNTANNYGQSRIRKVVDSTTLELYHGLNGFTTTTPAKIIQVDGANRIAPADIRKVGNKWEMQVTPFQFFGAFPGLSAHDENMGLLTSDSIIGPYTWNHLATPSFTRGAWKNQVSNENLVFLHTPITVGPIPTPTPTPPPTPTPSPTPTPPPDTTAPTVNTTSPLDGAVVSGTVNVAADASDDIGVVGIQFKLDGNNLGGEDLSSPYLTSWNSLTSSNGLHALSATTRDAAGNTATSSINVSVNNKIGVNFDGTDDIINGPTLPPPSQITISSWIKPTTLGEGSAGNIFTIRDDSDNNPNVQLRFLTGNKLRFLVVFDNAGALKTGYWDTPSNSITLGNLQHVVVTYDSASAVNSPVIYINGVAQTLTQGGIPTGVFRNQASVWRIGNSPNLASTFQGIIDETRIYDKLLSSSEVATQYNNGQLVNGQAEAGLVLGYHFDENAGSIANDYSGNNNNGSLVNNPLWVVY